MEFDMRFIIKFVICFILFVILPVWVFNFTDTLTIGWKLMFTVGGGIGLVFALNGMAINPHAMGRRR